MLTIGRSGLSIKVNPPDVTSADFKFDWVKVSKCVIQILFPNQCISWVIASILMEHGRVLCRISDVCDVMRWVQLC